jgi:glycosyltransferase involved in cell wall biosynthesis
MTKVNPADIPQRANLHWLGGRDYGLLPAYAKAFDVCLMPFALNEATEFINPTKALEYMATGRPIVSTTVRDVVLQFSDIVEIADSRAEFVAACQRVLANPPASKIARGVAMAKRNSWDSIVRQMQGHIADVLAKQARLETTAA